MQGLSSILSLDPAALAAVVAACAIVVAICVLIMALLRGERTRAEEALRLARLGEVTDRLAAAQAELAGRLDRGQASLEGRLEALSSRVGDGLVAIGERTADALRGMHERLAVIDRAQRTIGELSSQVISLQGLLSNKQARGAFGEVQLNDLISGILPPSAYATQATLSNGSRADALLKLPSPPGPIAVDAKFPLESYRSLRDAGDEPSRVSAARAFASDMQRHIRDIADKYIIPGETADGALMFLPAESVYAELHANFRNVVEESYRRKVWIVSPTTLWATLNTVRAVLRDVRLKDQARVLQAELVALAADLGRLEDRVVRLQRHLDQAADDLRQIHSTAETIGRRAARIDLSGLDGPPLEVSTAPPRRQDPAAE